MRLLALLALLVPSAALAQPGTGAPPPPPPAYAPAPAPMYQAPPANQFRNGLTFEANLGLGFIWASVEGDDSDTELALGGLSLGLGGWVNPQLAITARIAGVTYSEDCGVNDTCTLTSAFFGPVAQFWVNEQAWVGGGAGVAVARTGSSDSTESDTEQGFGLNLRAGYSFSMGGQSTWNVSVEYTPGFYSIDTGFGELDFTIHGFGILFGYQHF